MVYNDPEQSTKFNTFLNFSGSFIICVDIDLVTINSWVLLSEKGILRLIIKNIIGPYQTAKTPGKLTRSDFFPQANDREMSGV